MNLLTPLRRLAGAPAGPGNRRSREPAGIIEPRDATARLASFVGRPLGRADTSMDRLVVEISTNPVHLLVVAGPLILTSADGSVAVCHAPGVAVAAVMEWSGRPITRVEVLPTGGLRIDCGAGNLRVEADPKYEAWEVRGMDGGLLACLPGGRISLWTPADNQE
ncbi:MAG: DUF6188 family protein [Candidatus Nanopelagicales bacterium]